MPRFVPSHGYITEKVRRDWMDSKYLSESDCSASLVADPNPAAPLYHWQLFSLIGQARIEQIVRAFYTRIYEDNEPGSLKHAFTRTGSIDHHVATQAAMWADAFGGGRQYHGGDGRLKFHHTQNAGHVMNAPSAKRWMKHMARALNVDIDFSAEDPRVKPCLIEFLRARMQKYAGDHAWQFDPSDFDFEMEGLYFADELRAMPVGKLKQLVRLRGLPREGLVEKEDFARALACTLDELRALPVGRLRSLLRQRGLSASGLVEKADWVAAIAAGHEVE